ncbi:MAG: hypothetical protein KF696_12720 [Planctomycetes bacterium]|nr:hypothetical protein [Planctomycetota bacterium]MCW8135951.1 hypothetical protein [Planctomycetota bacterium]
MAEVPALYCPQEPPVDADKFTLETLIKSMKDLRGMSLGEQVREAINGAKLGIDPESIADLVRELESDIEEHIDRLERMHAVMSDDERAHPELLDELRKREVAFKSGNDLEEVESLCEAFSRAREILAGLKKQGGGVIDVKLLFSNLPGLSGLQLDGEGGNELLRGILDGTYKARGTESEVNDVIVRAEDLAGQIDLTRVAAPKNRLPKNWKP